MNKHKWNVSKTSNLSIQEDEFDYVLCVMVAIVSRGKWVKQFITQSMNTVLLCLFCYGCITSSCVIIIHVYGEGTGQTYDYNRKNEATLKHMRANRELEKNY